MTRATLGARPNVCLEALGQDARHRQQDEQQREGEDEVHQPAEGGVQPAPRVAGDDADHDAQDEGDERAGERDQQRDPRAVEQPGEQVTPGAGLDAERVGQADAAPSALGQAARVVDHLGVERQRVDPDQLGDQRREDGDQDDQQHDAEADHRHLVPTQAAPGDLGEGSAGDLGLLDAGAGGGLDRVVGCERHGPGATSPRSADDPSTTGQRPVPSEPLTWRLCRCGGRPEQDSRTCPPEHLRAETSVAQS